jgi:hypothetical protein
MPSARSFWAVAAPAILLTLVGGPRPATGSTVEGALLVLEASTPFAPGQDFGGAPLRFVLLPDGQVYAGGSRELVSGRIEKGEVKALEAQIEAVRKLPGLASVVSFGSEEPSFRLRVGKGKPLDLRISGDPQKAGPAFRPLSALLLQLLRFDHPSLQPFRPASLALSAREAVRPGGCRLWTLAATPAEAEGGVTVEAGAAASWAPGILPTAVCVGDKRYEVRLRPLVPGERP